METIVQPVILSGGSGTRLWPLSRLSYPKQFLPLNGPESLLVDTVRRIAKLHEAGTGIKAEAPLVISNEAHRFLVAEQLRTSGLDQPSIILEPFGRNTAPALTLAALEVYRDKRDPILVVLPSDHIIQDENRFRKLVAHGASLATQGHVITFGIVPTQPETGFGYLRKGRDVDELAVELIQFVEKPDLDKAREFLEIGNYFWNSGIFMMKASTWVRELTKHAPDILSICERALSGGKQDGIFRRIEPAVFRECPSISIDHAVMEKIIESDDQTPASMLPMDVGWSDLGSWAALHQIGSQDPDGNVIEGDVITKQTRNSLVYSQSKLVAVLGIEDLVVVETTDAVLVAHKNCSQDINAISDHLRQEGRPEHEFHQKVHRPWGSFESLDQGPRYQVKRLTVAPGASLSLQMHHHRAEHWVVVKGTARVTRGDETFLLGENQSTYIPLGTTHRLENPSSLTLEIIEIQSGGYLGEDDIVRFDDDYDRVRPHPLT